MATAADHPTEHDRVVSDEDDDVVELALQAFVLNSAFSGASSVNSALVLTPSTLEVPVALENISQNSNISDTSLDYPSPPPSTAAAAAAASAVPPSSEPQEQNSTGNRSKNTSSNQDRQKTAVSTSVAGSKGKHSCNVIVAGLLQEMGEEDLHLIFSRFGTILSVVVKLDLISGKSRGFGFVRFARHEDAACAVAMMHRSRLGPNVLNVELSKHDGHIPEHNAIFVRMWPDSVNEEATQRFFSRFGNVLAVRPSNDRESEETTERRGYRAHNITISYRRVEEARAALSALHGTFIELDKPTNLVHEVRATTGLGGVVGGGASPPPGFGETVFPLLVKFAESVTSRRGRQRANRKSNNNNNNNHHNDNDASSDNNKGEQKQKQKQSEPQEQQRTPPPPPPFYPTASLPAPHAAQVLQQPQYHQYVSTMSAPTTTPAVQQQQQPMVYTSSYVPATPMMMMYHHPSTAAPAFSSHAAVAAAAPQYVPAGFTVMPQQQQQQHSTQHTVTVVPFPVAPTTTPITTTAATINPSSTLIAGSQWQQPVAAGPNQCFYVPRAF